jgi:peroxiredoxin
LIPAAFALIAVNTPAPNFTLSDIHGNSYTLNAQTGKVVMLEWFFTT